METEQGKSSNHRRLFFFKKGKMNSIIKLFKEVIQEKRIVVHLVRFSRLRQGHECNFHLYIYFRLVRPYITVS